MYNVWSNIKFYIGIGFQLLIIFAMSLVGWGMSFTSVDLATAPQTTGAISFAGNKLTNAGRAGNVNSFVVQVNNEPIGYWIYRANGNYSTLYSALKVGTQVVIYHSQNVSSNGLYTVYQLQVGDHVDYSKDEYEGKEKWTGRLVVLPGAIALLVVIYYQIRKRRRASHTSSI